MKARLTEIYWMQGGSDLPNGENAEILALESPSLTGTLTTNPESAFFHIDKSAALANQLLNTLFVPAAETEGTFEERLASKIAYAKASRAKRNASGVFLIMNGETDILTPNFKARRDMIEFGLCVDDVSKEEIRDTFRSSIENLIIALSLTLPADVNRQFEKLGEVVYLVDFDDEKPIYAFNSGGSARASVAGPITSASIAQAVLVPKLRERQSLARLTSLLITSLERSTHELQSFIAAWSALEMFVNSTFNSTYERRWYAIMEDGAPHSGKAVFERLKEVMSDKYRVADKFLVVASVLDPRAAVNDALEFKRLKKFRDDLLHGISGPQSTLPTDGVQRILLKYINLHLGA